MLRLSPYYELTYIEQAHNIREFVQYWCMYSTCLNSLEAVHSWGKEKDLQNLDGLTKKAGNMLNHVEGPDQSSWKKNKKNYQ